MNYILETIAQNRRLAIFAGAVFVFALVATAPATLLTGAVRAFGLNIAYSNVEGTIWRGRIHDSVIGGVRMGNLEYSLNPVTLLIFSPSVRANASGGAIRGEGIVRVAINRRIQIRKLNAEAALNQIVHNGIMGTPVNGAARLNIEKIELGPKGCVTAHGDIWTNALDEPARQFGAEGFSLAGPIGCEGNNLVVALGGQSIAGQADFTLTLTPELTYHIAVTATPSDQNLVSTLQYFGFEETNGKMIYGTAGVIRRMNS